MGQIVNGATSAFNVSPVPVSGGMAFQQLALPSTNELSCGLTRNGQAFGRGANNAGQLGDGAGIARLTPVAVPSS